MFMIVISICFRCWQQEVGDAWKQFEAESWRCELKSEFKLRKDSNFLIKFQPSVETDRSWAAADSAQTDRLASRQTQLTVVVYSDSKLDQKEEDQVSDII